MGYHPFMEHPGLFNNQRPFPSFNEGLNNYNFNINMNLYLNSLPQYPDVNLGPINFGGAYNPYLNLSYQSMLFSQLNQLPQNFANTYLPAPNFNNQ
jgi:hypothetical protein